MAMQKWSCDDRIPLWEALKDLPDGHNVIIDDDVEKVRIHTTIVRRPPHGALALQTIVPLHGLLTIVPSEVVPAYYQRQQISAEWAPVVSWDGALVLSVVEKSPRFADYGALATLAYVWDGEEKGYVCQATDMYRGSRPAHSIEAGAEKITVLVDKEGVRVDKVVKDVTSPPERPKGRLTFPYRLW